MRSRLARACLAVGLCVASLAAQADMAPVKPGQVPTLRPDQGLVLMAIDTHVPISQVRLLRNGEAFGAGVMSELPKGRSYRLFVATAGDYAWRDVILRYGAVRLEDEEELHFQVEAGRINYAGDLLFRPQFYFGHVTASASISLSNRALAAIDWLQAQHPTLYARFELAYRGHYPDPFPAFYRAQHPSPDAASGASAALKPPPAPVGPLPIEVRSLWRPMRFQSASLNPAGDLLAVEVHDDEGGYRLDVVDVARGATTPQLTSKLPFNALQWSGDRNLVISLGSDRYFQTVWVVRMGTNAAGEPTTTRIRLPRTGTVVDPLPQEPDHLLFASISGRDELMVHKLDVSSQAAVDAFEFTFKQRLNTGTTRDVSWLTDGAGRLRLARIWRNGEQFWVHGDHGVYTDLMRLENDIGFTPVHLSHDGSQLYALSDTDREQREAVVFDIASRRITTVFAKPGADIDSLILDDRRTPIGVTYREQGRAVTEFFDAAHRAVGPTLAAVYPGKVAHVVTRSRDGNVLGVVTEAGDQPPQLHVLVVAERATRLIDGNTPWLAGLTFAPTRVVPFRAQDGSSRDAFLTLPEASAPRPLVVLPHGGPVGVADRVRFDPEVQFLASLGYAVLQVNFRGSDGYGKAFREAGHQAYGTGIEDDIDAAIAHVLRDYPLDASRMCVMGSSYGGYSALVTAVRWPDRFRCVISIAGVSDRVLFFTASDGGRSREGRARLEKVLGSPRTDLEHMQATSPLYRFGELKAPVMLAHGLEDHRVDYEHARRLLRMLDLAGRTPVGLEFAEEGHPGFSLANTHTLYTGVAGFLQQALGAPAGGAAAAAAKPTAAAD